MRSFLRKAFARRRPWIVGIIAVMAGPYISMFYLNKGKAACAYFFAITLCSTVLAFAMASFHTDNLILILLNPLTFALILYVVGIIHCMVAARKFDPSKKLRWYARWYGVIVLAVTIGLFDHYSFRNQSPSYHIPSIAMMPTLCAGDKFISDKYMQGWHSPGSISLPPARGAVVVFSSPMQPGIEHIKRVIGLPGDTIQIAKGALIINGKAVRTKRVEDFICQDKSGAKQSLPQYAETLPNHITYRILDTLSDGPADNTPLWTVPPRHYFLLGDNRDNSRDSRYMADIGFVPEENIIAEAAHVYWSGCEKKYALRIIE